MWTSTSRDAVGASRPRAFFPAVAACLAALVLAACGGGGGGGGGGGTSGVAPSITTQPTGVSVVAGASATFTAVAAGDAPLGYQWQRGGVDIAGANAASYAVASTVLADNGAAFRVVVTNPVGSATSTAALLTVTAAPPVLTITSQPADASVVAGTSATFAVTAACSTGTLAVQWQRGTGTFVDIVGATSAAYTIATTTADNAVQFRARLACSGASATTSRAALLTVTMPTAASLAKLPVTGLRDSADVTFAAGIVQDPGGSFTFITTSRIKRLSADGTTVTPVAGGGAPVGAVDGPADVARFNGPQGIAEDAAGTLYVADTNNHTIRVITTAGVVSTLAGTAGVSGSADGTGAAARFNLPIGIALGPDGDLYVGDNGNHTIRRVTTAGVVTTYAGMAGNAGFTDSGSPTSARFALPRGVAVAADGTVYVADYGNLRLRTIARAGGGAGAVSTLVGNGTNTTGTPDGPGNVASIPFPSSLALRGNVLAFYDESALLRRVDVTTGVVSTFASTRFVGNTPFYADGAPGKGYLHNVRGIASVAAGGYLVSDTDSLRTVSTTGVIRTIASAASDTAYTADGIGTLPQIPIVLGFSQAIAVDPSGNVVLADEQTHLVRRVAPTGAVTLIAGLTGNTSGLAIDGTGSEAQFRRLGPIAVDSAGVVYVTDQYGVRRIGIDGAVTFLAGSPTAFGSGDGSGASARFYALRGIAVSPLDGTVFVSDDRTLRRIDAAGTVATVVGATGMGGDLDGPAASARLQAPGTMAFAADGTLYFIDAGVVKRLSADGSTVSRLPLDALRDGLAVAADGTLYFGSANGLESYTTAGVRTLLIPIGAATVLGANPSLLNVVGIAVLGPKRLVVQTGFDRLIATLP